MKPKKCKGIGRAKDFNGCGKLSNRRKYGLCMDTCYKNWLFNSDEGKSVLNSSINRAKVKVKKKIKTDNFKKKIEWRNENKSLKKLVNDARLVFQRYIRLRDDKRPCISCGTFYADTFDGGHYLKAGIYTGMIFDEMNVHKQCRACNRFQHGNEAKYRIGLLNRYDSEIVNRLEGNSNFRRDYKFTRYELTGIKKLYNLKIKEFKNETTMARFKYIEISKETKEKIIHFFKTEKNNTMPIIAEKFGYSTYKVSQVITEYYSSIKKETK